MFDNVPDPKYKIQFSFGTGVNENFITAVEKFAVRGGSRRTIKANGENGVGDADLISEFYQAKQFLNLTITVPLNLDTLIFQKYFSRKTSFSFVLAVKCLSPDSRLRALQMTVDKAHFTKAPVGETELTSTINMKFTNPQMYYWYEKDSKEVFEAL